MTNGEIAFFLFVIPFGLSYCIGTFRERRKFKRAKAAETGLDNVVLK